MRYLSAALQADQLDSEGSILLKNSLPMSVLLESFIIDSLHVLLTGVRGVFPFTAAGKAT